ncbi:MAG: hypothetical protein KW793_04960 [Candidatus Doudnabacteria bacterium]|nr:hypothetical protein [Candidatus Doudnabacteria bacterium]
MKRSELPLSSLKSIRKADRNYQRKKRAKDKDGKRAQSLKWFANNPEKKKAHYKVWYAVKVGKLLRKPCEVCGLKKVHAHHEDYSRPLDVRWLCPSHHQLEHV